jgi:hypothetical protein
MLKLRNPLPKVLQDDTYLQDFYRGLKLVPYAGSSAGTSHAFLRLLCDFYDLSPSHGSCVDDKVFWSVQGDVDIIRQERPGLKMDRPELSDAEKVAYYDYLESAGIYLPEFIETMGILAKDDEKTGNAYLRFREVRVGDEYVYSVKRIDPMHFMYIYSEPGQPKTGVISKHLYNPSRFLERDDEYEVVNVWPNWKESGPVRETVFHWKNNRSGDPWYGRPASMHSLYWMFVEWQKANHVAKVSQSELTAIAFMFLEKPDPNSLTEDGKDSDVNIKALGKALRKVTTNRGDNPESLGIVDYPNGAQTPQVTTVNISRDSKWLETGVKVASNYIYAAHRWSKVLNGFERPSSGIGGNVLIDEFITRNASTIEPMQQTWESRAMQILREVNSRRPQFAGYGVKLSNKVESLVESLKGSQSGNGMAAIPEPQNTDEDE